MSKSLQEIYDELYTKYPGKWVAYRDDGEVVASAEDIEQLEALLDRLGIDGSEVIVGFIPEANHFYVLAN